MILVLAPPAASRRPDGSPVVLQLAAAAAAASSGWPPGGQFPQLACCCCCCCWCPPLLLLSSMRMGILITFGRGSLLRAIISLSAAGLFPAWGRGRKEGEFSKICDTIMNFFDKFGNDESSLFALCLSYTCATLQTKINLPFFKRLTPFFFSNFVFCILRT